MPNETREVLARSRELGNPPYDCQIRYQGLEVGLSIHQKNQVNGYKDSNAWTDLIEINAVSDPLIESSDIATQTCNHPYYSSEEVSRVATNHKATSLEETVTDPREEIEPSVFYYEGNKYIVTPRFSFIYEVSLEDSNFSRQGVITTASSPPITLPKQKQKQLSGTIDQIRDSGVQNQKSIMEFQFDHGIIGKIFKSPVNIPLELREPKNNYTVTELISNRTPDSEDISYVPCTVEAEDDIFKIKTTDEADTEAIWLFELDALGTLPDYVAERVCLDDLLINIDENENLIAQIKPSHQTKDNKWKSIDGDWELQSVD